ncbi:MAG: nuclear transport factor 2 family protein [Xanthomonadales bacterium]|nr:nuclear transport factor 2 family protein [Xanthomonadales bacterium]
MRKVLVILAWTLLACSASVSLADAGDAESVRQMFAEYRGAWLAGDEAGVLSLLSDEVQVFVPGASGGKLDGKAAVKAFWFPPSDISYPIRKYEISDRQIHVQGDLAVVTGRSQLDWDTVEGGEITDSASSSSEFMSVLRREDGQWRIFRQMYQMR